jgi:hypothetical protein
MPKRAILSFVTSIVVVGLLVIPGVAMDATAQKPGDWTMAQILSVKEEHTDNLFGRPGVVGTAVGHNRRGKRAIKVYVRDREDVADIPKKLNGVPVVVEVSGDIFALKRKKRPPEPPVDPTARFERPVPIGVSTGHPNVTAGTIACRVTDGNNVFALSDNHVYADENKAGIGDDVLQPGFFDDGVVPDDAIGTLFDFEPIYFEDGVNEFDAATALSSTSMLGNGTPSDGYGIPKSQIAEAMIGMRVMKYGRTTSQTKGRIDAIHATVYVEYDTGIALFVDQIVIKPGSFSAPGDSGSLVVVQRGGNARKPVGLVFAGSPTMTIANPIGPVLERFKVTVDGQ